MKKYFTGILRWSTQTLNVFLWPIFNWYFKTDIFGHEDEYTSSALGKLERAGNKRACRFCKFLSIVLFDPNHCIKSIEEDEGYE